MIYHGPAGWMRRHLAGMATPELDNQRATSHVTGTVLNCIESAI